MLVKSLCLKRTSVEYHKYSNYEDGHTWQHRQVQISWVVKFEYKQMIF